MVTRSLKPDMLDPNRLNAVVKNNQTFLDNYKTGSHKILDLEILDTSSANTVYLKPRTSIDGDSAFVIWIKGIVHVIPSLDAFGSYWQVNSSPSGASTSGINMTDKIGYRVDGSTGTEDALNIWAFANEANTEFQGFAYTKSPDSTFTSITGGGFGTLATFNGITNARSFTVGAKVRIYRNVGAFPHQWTYGNIQSIPGNTSLIVQLYPSLGMQNTAMTSGSGELWQMDKFFPWNGRTDTSDQADRIFKSNYRLVGQTKLSTGGVIFTVRKSDYPWEKMPYTYSNAAGRFTQQLHNSATTTTVTTPWARIATDQTKAIIVLIVWQRNGFNIYFNVNNLYGGVGNRTFSATETISTAIESRQVSFRLNQDMLTSSAFTTSSTGAWAFVNQYNSGWYDGGIQEL